MYVCVRERERERERERMKAGERDVCILCECASLRDIIPAPNQRLPDLAAAP